MIRRIEIEFAIPVEMTDEQQATIARVVQEIAKANEKPGRAHWLFGSGSKPRWNCGEIEGFDDTVLCFQTAERVEYKKEAPDD
jgi:hypothetical protein